MIAIACDERPWSGSWTGLGTSDRWLTECTRGREPQLTFAGAKRTAGLAIVCGQRPESGPKGRRAGKGRREAFRIRAPVLAEAFKQQIAVPRKAARASGLQLGRG